jgi:large subunit ribosomal protein L6
MPGYEVQVNEGVYVSLEGRTVKFTGPLGELRREFSHPRIKIKQLEGRIVLSSESERAKVNAVMGTWKALLRNMQDGVTRGFECSMKVVYSHFPIKLQVESDKLVIRNFLGERSIRVAKILPGVEIKIEGDEVKLSGVDKEKVGQTAANIEHATKLRGRDRRVFQDGIYITRKPAPKEAGD